jgi:DNA-binding transcriptional MerR regulator
MDNRMRIGKLAELARVTPRTVRYYESLGLIAPGEREGNSQHYYTEETLYRLRKIDQLKKLGLSLEEIGDVINLYFIDPSGIQPKSKVLLILRKHLEDTDQSIVELQQFRADLQSHIERFEKWIDEKEKH